MKPTLTRHASSLAAIALATGIAGAASAATPDTDASIAAALAAVNARCPHDYPDTVTPIPEPQQLATLPTASLIGMLESWNPSLRATAAKELAKRGSSEVDALLEATRAANWTVRAGAAEALAAIASNHPPVAPAPPYPAELAAITEDFIRLTTDDTLDVRTAALGGLTALAPPSPAAAMAVLRLCADADAYLAQDAMITLEKKFSIAALQQDEVITAFKQTFATPLPRGKGHIMRLIARMEETSQRQFIPELLGHLDWKPTRDTMFAKGGQEEALDMLTRLKEPGLIPRLPALMGKTFHGPGLFTRCLASARSFGKDARTILPELRAILTDIEKNGNKAAIKPHQSEPDGLDDLKRTIAYLESL